MASEKTNEQLIEYVRYNNINDADELLKKGANINFTDKFGNTPLKVASSVDAIKNLIDRGADVNARNHSDYGKTPLMHSLSHQDKDNNYLLSFKALIDAGADVNQKDYNGKTALMQPMISAAATEILIKEKANVNAIDHDDKSVLMHALSKTLALNEDNRLLNVEQLVHNGADVNYARFKDGKTTLMYVEDVSDAQFLLAAGADIHAENADGKKAHEVVENEGAKAYLTNHMNAYLSNQNLQRAAAKVLDDVKHEPDQQSERQRLRL